ncbi:hypothetical protein [Burkholderia territorii]|uniref:hypothetical protein n=1 Tax=Burkholderia territorii TaxID=1503055 RepID=UPI0012D9894E|nr:hypothetical protein [Burkholderia territorii]
MTDSREEARRTGPLRGQSVIATMLSAQTAKPLDLLNQTNNGSQQMTTQRFKRGTKQSVLFDSDETHSGDVTLIQQ